MSHRPNSTTQARIQCAIKALLKKKGEVYYQDIPALRADIQVKGVTVGQIADALRALRDREIIRLRTYRDRSHELVGWTRIWMPEVLERRAAA